MPGYHFGKGIRDRYDVDLPTATLLTGHLLATFPVLKGTRVDATWGGVIDTSTRFAPLFGTAHGGRVAYVTGFTGLGVSATRFGAQVVLDLLAGADTELTSLSMVRKRPLPFPPEPLAWLGITATTRALARADASGGRRGPWLRTLDRFGVGFDF
ncbi:MAG: dependent oxidoreductase [Frankiales bacterium]|nr:dependent oxidoreductase [Frankiales bacterium]